jgi:hypothetical protein
LRGVLATVTTLARRRTRVEPHVLAQASSAVSETLHPTPGAVRWFDTATI